MGDPLSPAVTWGLKRVRLATGEQMSNAVMLLQESLSFFS